MRLLTYLRTHLLLTAAICLVVSCLAFNLAQRILTGSRGEEAPYTEDGGININNGSIWDDPSPEHLLGPGTLR